jgi:Rhodopirellula transposase DDE domain
VVVRHLPPGTSKWNKIEHRLFSHISMNWRGRPLVSHEVVVKLIGATMTKNGLKVKAKLDKRKYPLKVKVTRRMELYHPAQKAEAQAVRLFKLFCGGP